MTFSVLPDTSDSGAAVSRLQPQCLSIDLEVGRQSARIQQLAALRGDSDERLTFPPGTLEEALTAMDQLAAGARFLLGHNLIAFDLPQLRAVQPGLQLLNMPVIDTLRLNPLAFPQNPYHHLVKHYQDGQLLVSRKNDPLLDAELALQVFCDQEHQLSEMQQRNPDLLLAWHWLTTRDQSVSGLNRFFMVVRRKSQPHEDDARAALNRLLADTTCTTAAQSIIADAEQHAWPLAYALA